MPASKTLYRRVRHQGSKGYLEIRSALWATGGLEVVSIKLPLSLPSPRASNPAGLDRSRANIAFANPYELPSESLQKCGRVGPDPLGFLFFLTPVGRFVAFTENDKLCFFLFSSLPAAGHRRERLLLPK